MPTLSPTSKKLHEDVVRAGEERVKKIITPTVQFNADVYNQAAEQVMKLVPQYFTVDDKGNPVPKPQFNKIAQAQVDSVYQKLIQQK